MKLLIILSLFSFSVFSKDYVVDKNASKVYWHLYIAKDTDVYGYIPISDGSFSLDTDKKTGTLQFSLSETKSYEEEDGKKEWSSSRDNRIYSITSAKEKIPQFNMTNIFGMSLTQDVTSEVEIEGSLTLNGVSKKIKLTGKIKFIKNKFIFDGTYKLSWEEFDIGNPVMWIMRAAKTADSHINLKFNIEANQQ